MNDQTEGIFQPYEKNGGSAVAIAGSNFVLVACDNRLSNEHTIFSSHHSKLHEITGNVVLATTGCECDGMALMRTIKARADIYKFLHWKSISPESLANMLSLAKYNKRFMPFNVENIVAGLDRHGKGVIYNCDTFGHLTEHKFTSIGTGGKLMGPIMDSVIGTNTEANLKQGARQSELGLVLAEKVIESIFITACARDIYTGDSISLKTITSQGISTKEIQLAQ